MTYISVFSMNISNCQLLKFIQYEGEYLIIIYWIC